VAEPESCELGDDPDRWVPGISERKKGERESWARGLTRPGKEASRPASWAARGGKGEKKKGRLELGRVEEKDKGKRERGSGPSPKRKRERKRIAFNYI
jgi:hypothetical protein